MPKPPTTVRSIRLQNDVWAWLAEEAARRETTVNGLVDDLIEVARLRVAERAAAPERAPVKPKPAPKVEAPATFGPVRRKPGELLKKR